jgi:hypothetical protein
VPSVIEITLSIRSTWNHSVAIAPQFLPPCVCIASFSLMSSPTVQLPIRLVPCRCRNPSNYSICSNTACSFQCGNCTPILATMHLCRVLQLVIFVCCPVSLASVRPVTVGMVQDIIPSALALIFPSTRNQRDNCGAISRVVRATTRVDRLASLA